MPKCDVKTPPVVGKPLVCIRSHKCEYSAIESIKGVGDGRNSGFKHPTLRPRSDSMKITIKDYLKNTVAGPNKLVIKENGVTLKNGTNVQYYYTTDGVLTLKNIPVPQSKNYTSIEVITQDRLAYNSQRNTTKVIKITN